MSDQPLSEIDLKNIPFLKRGKVREIYELPEGLVIVSTDRISCFDVILPTPIPGKGEVLTSLSRFWFDLTSDVVANHLITVENKDFPSALIPYEAQLRGRAMLVKKAQPLPVECVVRGYLSGSGWKEYQKTGKICGIGLPMGLRESDKLPEIIFTPSTKADIGHDENVSIDYVIDTIGKELADKIQQISIALYRKASVYAEERGIIIADTKFEFGIHEGELILIDEVLTPDSSRFWPKDVYKPGQGQPSFDKQFVRDYLESTGWNKTSPGPELPPVIVSKTAAKYRQALEILARG